MAATVLDTIAEGTTGTYTATLTDESGAALSGLPSSIRMTLYSLQTGAIINSRNNQNILNANNVVITAAGVLTWKLQEADVVIVDPEPLPTISKHCAVIVVEWTDSGGVARQKTHEVIFPLRRLQQHPFIAP